MTMSIAQTLTATRTQVPDLATIRTDMEATRAAYHRLLESLSDADLQRPCVISQWTIKEVLCHMALLIEQAVPMMVKQARKGKSMPKLLDTRFGHWMNYQMAYAQRARRLGRRSPSATTQRTPTYSGYWRTCVMASGISRRPTPMVAR